MPAVIHKRIDVYPSLVKMIQKKHSLRIIFLKTGFDMSTFLFHVYLS